MMDSMPKEVLRAGSELSGRYRVRESLRRHPQVTEVRATQLAAGRRVRLYLFDEPPDGERDLERFTKTLRRLCELSHPAIAPWVDGGVLADGRSYAAQLDPGGESIEALVERDGELDAFKTRRLMVQLLDGLGFAHGRQMLHRSLSPRTVQLVPGGLYRGAVMVDFGLLALAEPALGLPRGRLLSLRRRPPVHAAPELQRGTLTAQADLYAWGVLTLELLGGELLPPRHGRGATSRLVLPEIDDPLGLAALARRAASWRVDERFEGVTALYSVMLGQEEVAQHPSAMPPADDDSESLHEQLQSFVEQAEWTDALEVLDELYARESNAAARARHAFNAGVLLRDELEDADRAVEMFERALDANVASWAAFESIEALLRAQEDWGALSEAYERLIERLEGTADPRHQKRLAAAYRYLGELYRTELGDVDRARDAYVAAVDLLDDDDARRALREIDSG
jgi:tetratricopeptide (TPR) repeat protein